MKLSETVRRDLPDDAGGTYDAACFAANAADAAGACKTLPEAERRRLATGYADQSVKLLKMAIHEGYREHAHMAKDSDLDPLRTRPDYQELARGLEQRYPTPLRTPGQELTALQNEYRTARNTYQQMRDSAETVAAKKKAEAGLPRFPEFAQRAMQFAGS